LDRVDPCAQLLVRVRAQLEGAPALLLGGALCDLEAVGVLRVAVDSADDSAGQGHLPELLALLGRLEVRQRVVFQRENAVLPAAPPEDRRPPALFEELA
jgi:hypothetical protein